MPTHNTIKTIDSSQNPGFKLLRELIGSSRTRRGHQAAWLEGERLCLSFIEHQSAQAPILVTSEAISPDQLPAEIRLAAKEIWMLNRRLYAEITQLETPIGWGLLIPLAPMRPRSLDGDIVVLDRLQDPGNAGSIVRSAAAAGASAVWCVRGTVDLWSPKVLRAGMGAHFVIEIRQDLQTEEVLSACGQQGVRILATANSSQSDSLFDPLLGLDQPVAWIFGQEGSGVDAQFMAAASQVSIPQAIDVESLNVAAAAAVCLFESRRRKLGNAANGRY